LYEHRKQIFIINLIFLKMKKVFFLMLSLMILSAASVNAQVTIGANTDPHPGAVLDLESTTQGLKLPVVALTTDTLFQLAGDSTKAVGMVVFNSNSVMNSSSTYDIYAGTYVWNGSKWVRMSLERSRSGPALIGDSATYSTRIYPGNVGTWTTANSREGTPTYNFYDNDPSKMSGHYYTRSVIASACPSGWHVPTNAEWMLLRAWLLVNNLPDEFYPFVRYGHVAGWYNDVTKEWIGWERVGTWATSETRRVSTEFGDMHLNGLSGFNGNSAVSVRCKKDN
jgi:hypothetical protein